MIITGNKIASKVLFSHECSTCSMYINVMHYNLTQWMNHDAVMSESSVFVGISFPAFNENPSLKDT